MLLAPSAPTSKAKRSGILAFAPSFERTPTSDAFAFRALGELAHNRKEVGNLADRFKCAAYLDEDATSAQFKESAPDYAIIHLATHATADTRMGDFSYLSFSTTEYGNDDLKVGDLYGMNLPAELVVLSACETGLGEWRRGEGVVGLERAFSYAGAQSLVTTHWKVSDLASSDLMALFYDNLAQGNPKDVALQKAQLAFINTQDPWLAHPFFWAGFVQKGSTAPLSLPPRRMTWPYYGLAVLALTGSGWVFWKRKLSA
jgi:CHAT domain-containing protein